MKYWYVAFGINGEELLRIEPNCIGGDPDISDHADEVREAARHLFSFIGSGECCYCEPGQGGPCSFCMERKYNL